MSYFLIFQLWVPIIDGAHTQLPTLLLTSESGSFSLSFRCCFVMNLHFVFLLFLPKLPLPHFYPNCMVCVCVQIVWCVCVCAFLICFILSPLLLKSAGGCPRPSPKFR